MSNIDKQALREAANAANAASWGNWESYKPHKGARGYEVKVGVKSVAQHCLKVDSVFIAAANPATVLALLDELEESERLRLKFQEANCELCQKLEAAEKTSAARLGAIDTTHKMFQRERDRAEKAEKRIAELEAREVKLPELKMLSDYLAEVTMREREDILVGVRLEFFRALKEAGVNVAAAGKGETS